MADPEAPLETSVVAPPKQPRPKPLLWAVLLVSFFGGTCSVQRAIGAEPPVPTRAQVAKDLQDKGGIPPGVSEEAKQGYIGASHRLVEEKARLEKRYRPYSTVFGIALALAYTFSMIFAMRCLAMLGGAPRRLSFASLLVLPARVAMSTVDVSIAEDLREAATQFTEQLVQISGMADKPTPFDVNALTDAVNWSMVAAQVGMTVAICLLFTYAWRYFQRPGVVAWFEERERKPPPLE